ncbi:MAG TPA: twin-arginine translocation signal domain-containing protein, partial [Anaerolineales bacterium]|nr:twin-arginine translocation signal domain-containing protein [Anaerolineales bacterium]
MTKLIGSRTSLISRRQFLHGAAQGAAGLALAACGASPTPTAQPGATSAPAQSSGSPQKIRAMMW